VAQSETVKFVPTEFAYNFEGDPLFTDGQAALLTAPTAL
jgi:hypothetical protein